jgi:hypothetical protein
VRNPAKQGGGEMVAHVAHFSLRLKGF